MGCESHGVGLVAGGGPVTSLRARDVNPLEATSRYQARLLEPWYHTTCISVPTTDSLRCSSPPPEDQRDATDNCTWHSGFASAALMSVAASLGRHLSVAASLVRQHVACEVSNRQQQHRTCRHTASAASEGDLLKQWQPACVGHVLHCGHTSIMDVFKGFHSAVTWRIRLGPGLISLPPPP